MLSSSELKFLLAAFVVSTLPVVPEPLAQTPPRAVAESEVVSGNNQFALALYQNLTADESQKEENVFLSPYSISTALAMTYMGSRGNTQKQMASVMHTHMPDAALEAAYSSLLAQTQAKSGNHYELNVANALWGQQGFHFETTFTSAIRKYFDGGFSVVDFHHGREASVAKINQWVEDNTAGKIKGFLQPDAIDDLTRLILTNAVYFKGNWANPFDKTATRTAPFFLQSGKVVRVPMMYQEEHFRYMQEGGLQMIELPYAGNDLSMVVMLPEHDVEEIGANLSLHTLRGLRSRMAWRDVEVYFPRFKFETRFRLERPLSALGMPDAFDSGKADFSGMTGHPDLFLSYAIHLATLDVNEEGTEAAAAAEFGGTLGGVLLPPVIFNADRPFIFMILHKPTDSILFLGRVSNPPDPTPATVDIRYPPRKAGRR
jgi:serpin B